MQEIWLTIPETSGAYEVSNLGNVRSVDKYVGHRWGGRALKRGKVLKPRKDKNGYLIVSLSGCGCSLNAKIHRLVAKAFLASSDLGEVNHIDLNKENNAVSNLAWVDRHENQKHASASGVFSASANLRRAKKLTGDMVEEIRAKHKAGARNVDLAKEFGVHDRTISLIVRNLIWQ